MSEKDSNRGANDDDFDFENKKQNEEQAQKKANLEKDNEEKVENQHFDEAINLSSKNGSEIDSVAEDEADHARGLKQQEQNEDQEKAPEDNQDQQNKQEEQKLQKSEEKENSQELSGEEEGKQPVNIPGAYNPAEYESLTASDEVKELFKYITKYKPVTVELDSKLKAFIPDYIPAVGEVDAYIKMPRPDNKEEILGLQILDEPCLNQSKKAKLDIMYTELDKKTRKKENAKQIHSIQDADKAGKEIGQWINDVADVQKMKQPPTVTYSKPMPDLDQLLDVWPTEIEDMFTQIKLPNEELDLNLEDYSKMACSIMDIPVHPTITDRNLIESLHVLFTLYSEFKANQHFQQNNQEQVQQQQQQQQQQ